MTSRRHSSAPLQAIRTGVSDMYDSIAILYEQGNRTYDQYGNETVALTPHEVYVQPRSVYHSEYYQAAQAGLHPSITLEMTNREDYHGEKIVEFEGKTYDIIRTDWNAQRDRISLICQERLDADC